MAGYQLISENCNYASPIHQISNQISTHKYSRSHSQALPEKLCAPMGAKETVNNLGWCLATPNKVGCLWRSNMFKYGFWTKSRTTWDGLKTLQLLRYLMMCFFVYHWLAKFGSSLHSRYHQLPCQIWLWCCCCPTSSILGGRFDPKLSI